MAGIRLTQYAFLAAAVLLGVVGQLLLKKAATSMGASLLDMATNRFFFLAVAVYGVSVILYTLALRGIPLQIAFPAVSFSYVAVAYASHLLWGTPFGLREVAALSLIAAGVITLAWKA